MVRDEGKKEGWFGSRDDRELNEGGCATHRTWGMDGRSFVEKRGRRRRDGGLIMGKIKKENNRN